MSRIWSAYQKAIFFHVQHETGNAVVDAVAGSGKSTTAVEAVKHVPRHLSTIFLAFNKDIADELKRRGVNARTFHSLTYGAVLQHKGAAQVETNKLRRLCDANMSFPDRKLYAAFATRMVSLARQVGIGIELADLPATWMDLATLHDIEPDSENADFGRGIELASELLQWSNESPLVDFDDMLYLAVKDDVALPKFDYVFVDEYQDTNYIQRCILRKIMKPTSRIMAVGDPAQAIYGFRGADADACNMFAEEFNCKRLPLTISYRCDAAIIKYAQQWVEQIEARPGAAEGSVVNMERKWNPQTFQPGDLVVCRTTKPLVSLVFKLIRARIPAVIKGRKIGDGLVSIVKKMNASSIDDLEIKLDAWELREAGKFLEKQEEEKAEEISDKASALRVLIQGMNEDHRNIASLIAGIQSLFDDEPGNVVVLSTIHKAKGLEARRVFWLNRNQCPSKWARKPWQQAQELNLCYVAATRAMNELILIEE